MPNFLLIGAAKAGTTSLHRYINQHPEIFMSQPKELRFFPFEGAKPDFRGPNDFKTLSTMITTIEDYRACFTAGVNHRARGESSPLYMYYPRSAERIRHHVPDVRLIAILRQPAERAYSQFLAAKRDGREFLSFADALDAEAERIANGWSYEWHYRQRGFYAEQLRRYFDLFPREQLKIYLYEDYLTDPLGLMQNIFHFLNINESFVPDMSVRHNESTIPRSRALQVYLREPRKAKAVLKRFVPPELSRPIGDRVRSLNLAKPHLSAEQRRQLTEVYREDIIELQDLLQRDLSNWLK
ncbi:MAG: sulfotransferase [Pyrinomonadaceae bacterium]